MRIFAITTIAIILSGCVSTAGTGAGNYSNDPSTLNEKALSAFAAICLNTAPTFAEAEAAAIAYGITEMDDLGFQVMGMTEDNLLGVQVKENIECAVTTPSQTEAGLTERFLKSVSQYTGSDVGSVNPVEIMLNGETFLTGHDRSGGEAYVVLIPADRYEID